MPVGDAKAHFSKDYANWQERFFGLITEDATSALPRARPTARSSVRVPGREGIVRITHRHQAKPSGRGYLAAGGPVARGQRRGDAAGVPRPRSHPLQRPDDAPHLVVQERARPQVEADLRPASPGASSTVSSSSVLTGLCAWQVEERNVVKSCRPTRCAAPARIAPTSSRWRSCQAWPAPAPAAPAGRSPGSDSAALPPRNGR